MMTQVVSVSEVLRDAAARRPLMEPRDAVKLLYQSEYGCGHLLTGDVSAALRAEYAGLTRHADEPLTELLGGGFARLSLHALPPEMVDAAARAFLASAQHTPGTDAGMTEKLSILRQVTQEGGMPFPLEVLEAFLAGYEADGRPVLSHSDAYREAYQPAYRVIDERYARLLPLMARLHTLLRTRDHVVLALDGMAASGKTTAALLLSRAFPADIVQVDDFFLPMSARAPGWENRPGGNIDAERFARDISPRLRSDEPYAYVPFDCHTQELSPKAKAMTGARLVIVEGCCALLPRLRAQYDWKVFCCVSPETQHARLSARGEQALDMFTRVWLPLEELYFSEMNVRAQCDMTLAADEPAPEAFDL